MEHRAPRVFNGSQGSEGPKGVVDFSQCEHKTEDMTGNQAPITSNSLPSPIKVIKIEPSVSNLKGDIQDLPFCNFVDNGKYKDICQIV